MLCKLLDIFAPWPKRGSDLLSSTHHIDGRFRFTRTDAGNFKIYRNVDHGGLTSSPEITHKLLPLAVNGIIGMFLSQFLDNCLTDFDKVYGVGIGKSKLSASFKDLFFDNLRNVFSSWRHTSVVFLLIFE